MGVVLQRVLFEFEGVKGVFAFEEAEGEDKCLVKGEVWDLSGVGRIPHPVWKVLQFMPLKSLEGEEEEPNSLWPWGFDLLQYWFLCCATTTSVSICNIKI